MTNSGTFLAPGSEPLVARLEDLAQGGGSHRYPQHMRSAYEVFEFAGPGKGGAGGVYVENARVGLMRLPAGFHYALHSHPSPEVYVVVSGTGTWESSPSLRRELSPVTFIYHPPYAPHAVRVGPLEPLVVVYVWWGEQSVIEVDAELL
jgi:mannose-6-phosphate isomerase-like protein (cupin superfamily)